MVAEDSWLGLGLGVGIGVGLGSGLKLGCGYGWNLCMTLVKSYMISCKI